MSDELWGPIDPHKWRDVPCLRGRVAREEDVKQGRAVFYLGNLEEVPAWPEGMTLPALALWRDEAAGKSKRVVVIQAERSEIQCTVGVRFFEGGNGVCLLDDLELLGSGENAS